MSLTRKHYVALAEALHRVQPPRRNLEAWHAWSATCSEVATTLEDDNGRFDRKRFINATREGDKE